MADELKNTIAQSLGCPVCLNIFKDPKILPCSHTFCKACLDNLLECHGNEHNLRCPVCRADTRVLNHDVSQLQTNLALKSLIDNVESKQPLCTNCNSEEKIQAVVYCQDCGSYLCINCQTTHSKWNAFSDHEVIAMSKIKSGKVPIRRFRKCKKHPREDEECFCCNCRRFACFRCGIMEHKDYGHRVIEASMYERNHLKTVQELKSKADIKLSCIQKYVDLIDEQKDLVSTAKKQCIDDISDAYDESVRQLTEKKERLIGEVNSQTKQVDKDLDTMKEEAQKQITHLNAITNLVANGMKIPLEMGALAAHDTLCQKLQDTLMREDPDFKQPEKLGSKGKLIAFERGADVSEIQMVCKNDFQAERKARERMHTEKQALQGKIDSLIRENKKMHTEKLALESLEGKIDSLITENKEMKDELHRSDRQQASLCPSPISWASDGWDQKEPVVPEPVRRPDPVPGHGRPTSPQDRMVARMEMLDRTSSEDEAENDREDYDDVMVAGVSETSKPVSRQNVRKRTFPSPETTSDSPTSSVGSMSHFDNTVMDMVRRNEIKVSAPGPSSSSSRQPDRTQPASKRGKWQSKTRSRLQKTTDVPKAKRHSLIMTHSTST